MLGFLAVTPIFAQMPDGPVRRFTLPFVDKQTLRLKARLRGDLAQPAGPGLMEVQGASVESFGPAGETNLLVTSDRCYLRPDESLLYSPGSLRVSSPRGDFALAGQGFRWEPARGLVISNAVQAMVTPPGARVTSGEPEGSSTNRLRIRSERLTLYQGLAVFGPAVGVEDAHGSLRCDRLTLHLNLPDDPVGGVAPSDLQSRLETIEAEGDVRVQSASFEATSARAVYQMTNALVTLSGSPTWKDGVREGSAERMDFDRVSRRLGAQGGVRMRMPAAGVFPGGGLDLPAPGASAQVRPTSRTVELRSDTLDVVPTAGEGRRSEARFLGQVAVVEGATRLTSERMRVSFSERAGQDFEVWEAVAEGDVQLESQTNRVTCTRATYATPTGIVDLDGPVAWTLGQGVGESERLRVEVLRRTTRASGGVRMTLPAGSLGLAQFRTSGWPRRPGAAVDGGGPPPAATAGGAAPDPARPVAVTCEEFLYQAAASSNEVERVEYHGGVLVQDLPGTSLRCQTLTADVAGGPRQVRRLTADGAVQLEIKEGDLVQVARGDRAVYEAARQELRLSGSPGVEVVSRDRSEESRARGGGLVYDLAHDRLTLEPGASLESPRGLLRGDAVRLDRVAQTASASGLWRITLPVRRLKFELPESLERP